MLYLTAIYAVRQDKKNKPLTLCPFCWGTPSDAKPLALMDAVGVYCFFDVPGLRQLV